VAAPRLAGLREAVGLRRFRQLDVAGAEEGTKAGPALPLFKQYRGSDGRFYFKLNGADGRVLLQSRGFDSGGEAGEWVKRLKSEGPAALAAAPVARAEGVGEADVAEALATWATEEPSSRPQRST
jgi:tryptophanyl-tRNA synthetase